MYVLLTQVGTSQFPAVAFHALLRRNSDGYYYDADDETFKALDECITPEIAFSEVTNGEWDLELSLTVTGEYTITAHETASEELASEAEVVYLESGLLAVDEARSTTPISEDTGGADNLRYTDDDGEGIESAIIRVFDKAVYAEGTYDGYVGMSVTGSDGRWLHPVHVEPEHTYVITFEKSGYYGTDTAEVTV